MTEILEMVMLLCFGISWPISLIKGIRSKTTKGKSIVFIIAIIIGYIAGIASKICGHNITYILGFYIFNLVIVTCDLIVFLINKNRENKTLNAGSASLGE